MEHAEKRRLLLERIRNNSKNRKGGLVGLLAIFNNLWKPVTLTAFVIGFLNYWIYLYSIGRRDFIFDSLVSVNTFVVFSLSVIISTFSLAFFLYAPSFLIFLLRYERIGKGDFEPYFCLWISFFFSVFFILISSVAWGAIKSIFLLLLLTLFCISISVFIFSKMMFEVKSNKTKSVAIGFGFSLYSLLCMAFIFSLSDMSDVPEHYEFIAIIVLLIIQLLPGIMLFSPYRIDNNKNNHFVISVIFGIYMMFVTVPGAFIYAQLGSFNFMGVVDFNTHIFQIKNDDFDKNFITNSDWSLDQSLRCVKNDMAYQGKHLISGVIGFRSGGKILICSPNYPNAVKEFLRERMFIIRSMTKNTKVDLELETKKCIALHDTPSLQQDALEHTFLYGITH